MDPREFINPTAGKVLALPTANKAVGELERRGIIAEITGRQWRRFYLAKAILGVLEGPIEVAEPR